jgi:hypothetical protein
VREDATYADGRLQIKHLHYDHDATARRLRLAPLSPEVIEQLTGMLESGLVDTEARS